jgi:hypothetical protein
MYKVPVRPVLTYTSETWTPSKTDERLLNLFERILKCIFGAVQENGVWRKGYNHELYELFNERDIGKYIKIKRLGWAGHVIRMDNNRTVKKVFNTKSMRISKTERPKLRWEDNVIQDVETGSQELEELSNGKGRLEEASEGGQGPRRAVEPMLMMMS